MTKMQHTNQKIVSNLLQISLLWKRRIPCQIFMLSWFHFMAVVGCPQCKLIQNSSFAMLQSWQRGVYWSVFSRQMKLIWYTHTEIDLFIIRNWLMKFYMCIRIYHIFWGIGSFNYGGWGPEGWRPRRVNGVGEVFLLENSLLLLGGLVFLFYSGLELIGCGPPTLGKIIWLT